MKDPKKYLKQYSALEEAAKAEIIELLSNNPTGVTFGSIAKLKKRMMHILIVSLWLWMAMSKL